LAEQAGGFLDSRDPEKRAKLIQELLASPRFGEYFGDVWRGRLISPLANDQRIPAQRFADWLAERFHRNVGWDRIVFDLVTATGTMDENPAATYLIEGRFPLGVTDLTDLTSRYFLGVRLNCAQCHDHPFVAWKRQDSRPDPQLRVRLVPCREQSGLFKRHARQLQIIVDGLDRLFFLVLAEPRGKDRFLGGLVLGT
jgi:hypothetical protein